MIRSKKFQSLAITLLLCIGAGCAKKFGTLTIINNADKPLRGNLGETGFTIQPGNAWTKEDVPQGKQTVAIAGGESSAIDIKERHTTVFDPAGIGCYVVADFRWQYGDTPKPDVDIQEKFLQQKIFSPKEPLLVAYDRKLPKRIPDGSAALRLHKIDCAIANDAKQIGEVIMRMP